MFSRSLSKGQDLPRTHISMVGFMNAGKSSMMNAITKQPTSIVDNTPGTTADTKVSLMEIHSIGPCKLMDTAGIDESGSLGQKKLVKTMSAVKESDLVLYVVDPFNFDVKPFEEVTKVAENRNKQVAVIFNQFKDSEKNFEAAKASAFQKLNAIAGKTLPNLTLSANEREAANSAIVPFIGSLLKRKPNVPLIPAKFLGPDQTIFLNIPLDVESPTGRLLRPQTMMMEYSLRRFSPVVCFSMNLKDARGKSPDAERERFVNSIRNNKPSLVVTDSQAIDVVNKWTPNEFALTTFSIAMANVQSGGKLKSFLKGIDALSKLKPGDKVLICEACNHDRIIDDIGTVQIPEKLRKKYPDVQIDWAFGRSYEDKKLSDYALALHCGGCMISRQQMESRLVDLIESGTPVSNYGLALSWFASPQALSRVLKPWE